uniref:Uncharacterized protein n=1 Tax=viral metagenome TaxID=1070528 RepID=A0A6C0DLJ6_9ZZZZ
MEFSTPPRRPLVELPPTIGRERRNGRGFRNVVEQPDAPSILFPFSFNEQENPQVFSIPSTYARREPFNIEPLSNDKLNNYEGSVEIPENKIIQDLITLDETNIIDYINKSTDNIVFLYENNYYLSSKSMLSKVIDMTTTDNAIVFDCRGIGYANVDRENPYVLIHTLGILLNDLTDDIINIISLRHAIAITKPTSGQYFILTNTNNVVPTITSDNGLNGVATNSISGNHCQLGKSAILYNVEIFNPEITSSNKKRKSTGGKKKKTNKKSSKKNNKKKPSRKTYKRKSI